MLPEHDRRTFLAALGGAAALAGASTAEADRDRRSPRPPAASTSRWFDAFKGKHKQVFDLQAFDPSLDTPLRQVVTYLSVHLELNRLEPPERHQRHRRHLAQVVPDERHRRAVGEVRARRALADQGSGDGQAGGAQHLHGRTGRRPGHGPRRSRPAASCSGSATSRWARFRRELAAKTGGKAADIRADLTAGLRPGVRLVPAHTWAVGFVQERGFTYMSL